MGLFYTGKGDKGESVVGKKKIDKTCVEVEALGDLDELNSLIGIVKSESPKETKDILHKVQEDLFIIQANVANFMFQDENGNSEYPAPEFNAQKTREIESLIDDMENKVNPARGFIIPGLNKQSAWLDLLRAVTRRVERNTLKFNKKNELPEEILAYLNRLSSLFFAMARLESKNNNLEEEHPKYN